MNSYKYIQIGTLFISLIIIIVWQYIGATPMYWINAIWSIILAGFVGGLAFKFKQHLNNINSLQFSPNFDEILPLTFCLLFISIFIAKSLSMYYVVFGHY